MYTSHGKKIASYLPRTLSFCYTNQKLDKTVVDYIDTDTSIYKIFASNFSGLVNKSELDIPEGEVLDL